MLECVINEHQEAAGTDCIIELYSFFLEGFYKINCKSCFNMQFKTPSTFICGERHS